MSFKAHVRRDAIRYDESRGPPQKMPMNEKNVPMTMIADDERSSPGPWFAVCSANFSLIPDLDRSCNDDSPKLTTLR